MPDTVQGQVARLRRGFGGRFPVGTRTGDILRRALGRLIDTGGLVATPITATTGAVAMRRAWRSGRVPIGSNAKGRDIVMLVVSSLRVDPRVRAAAQTLAQAGYEITIIWPDRESSAELPDWGRDIAFEPLPASAARFASRYPGFLGREMLKAALKHHPFAFHAHDLNTMLIALIAGRRTGAHVVCDHHEWFAETARWSRTRNAYAPLLPHARAANRWLERFAFKHASAQITVCQSIADAMQRRYAVEGLAVHVIRNIPTGAASVVQPYPNLRTSLGIHSDQTLILYQGGVGPTRGLEPVIEALAQAPSCVLAIRGPSIERFSTSYRNLAVRVGVEHRLHLLPPVASADVVAACNGADAGLYTVTDVCQSFTLALPNKVFEYMIAGLPVLTADYPEVRRLIIDNGVGLGFNATDPCSIASAMNTIATPAVRREICAKLPAMLASIDPKAEWGQLAKLYREFGQTAANGERK